MNGRFKRRLIHILFILLYLCHLAKTQSLKTGLNANNALTDEEAEEIERRITQNVVKLAATDQLNSEIITNRTRAYLSCESGEMIVKINFSEPFRGIGYSDYDRTSPCKFFGDGGRYYEMRLPLKGCGTKQEAPRLFINNIILRFHRTLELEEDEIKTIVCRYPPPLAPPPPSISAPILEPTPPPVLPIPAKLSEVELLLIISALLFLTLLLLGIGMAYYCLKRRNIKVIRKRRVLSSGPPSEITKISSIEPIRIPRVAVSTSSSEPLVSSDYPSSSEERSVVSETSTIRRDHYKYENQAYIPEPYPMDIEREESVTDLPVPVIAKPNITKLDLLTTIRETQHLTDTDVYNTTHLKTTTKLYKKLPPVLRRKPASIPDDDDWSHSELEVTPVKRPYIPPPRMDVRNLDDYYLRTERTTDIDEDITRHRRFTQPMPTITTKTTDDYYLSPRETTDTTEDITTKRITSYPKPKITTKTTDDYYLSPRETTDTIEDTTTERRTTYPEPKLTTQTLDDYYRTDKESIDTTEDTTTERHARYPPPRGPKVTEQTEEDRYVDQLFTEITDQTTTRDLVQYPTPKYLVHTIDDTFITNISETETTEHIIASDKTAPPPPPPLPSRPMIVGTRPDWEVQINRYLVGPTTELPETKTTTETIDQTIDETIDTSFQYTSALQSLHRQTKLDVINRVIDRPPPDLPGVERLTTDVRQKLRTVITTDEVFRTLIIESQTIEEYTYISRDVRYERMFEPPTWVTIIRLFTLPEVQTAPFTPESPELARPPPRYKRKTSLPSISGEHYEPLGRPESIRSRRTSRSSSIFDVRSLTEEDVTFARADSIRYTSRLTTGYPPQTSRYLEDVPITSTPTPVRPLISRTTHISEYVVPPDRPYSPDIDALSLAVPSRAYTSSRYMSSYGRSAAAYGRLAQIRRTLDRTTSVGEKEETKSTTEKDVYDWKRY